MTAARPCIAPSGVIMRKSGPNARFAAPENPAARVRRGTRRRRRRAARRPPAHASVGESAGRSCDLPVQIVFHDRAVAAGAVALEREGVAVGSLAPRQHRGDLRVIRRASACSAEIAEVGGEVRAVARADDDRRDLRPVEHRAARDRGDVGAVAVGDPAQRAQQLLEQLPAAEIVDDQLVFGERAVLEGGCGSGSPSQRRSRKPPATDAVAEQVDAVPAAELDEAILRPGVEQRILHLHAARAARRPRPAPRVRGVSKLVPPSSSILPSRAQLLQPQRGLDAARNGVVPPVELHEVEPLHAEPLQRPVDDRAHMRAGRVAAEGRGRARTSCGP